VNSADMEANKLSSGARGMVVTNALHCGPGYHWGSATDFLCQTTYQADTGWLLWSTATTAKWCYFVCTGDDMTILWRNGAAFTGNRPVDHGR